MNESEIRRRLLKAVGETSYPPHLTRRIEARLMQPPLEQRQRVPRFLTLVAALLAIAIVSTFLFIGQSRNSRNTVPVHPGPTPPASSARIASSPTAESPLPLTSSTRTSRLVYRAWDGNQYSIVAADADGGNRVTLSGPNFAHPDSIRFVESRNRRWVAWADGGELRMAASGSLSSATTLATTSASLFALAISEDGDSVAYVTRTGNNPMTAGAALYVARVHDRSVKLLRKFDGPFISCVGDAAFDVTAKRLIAVGCGSGKAAGLLVLNAIDGSIISEDDRFLAWPKQWAFAEDLATVWLIDESSSENIVVRYDTATRNRQVLFHSPFWRQSDGSMEPSLGGLFVLSPNGSALAFSRHPQDRVPEVYVLQSSGGDPNMIFKSSSFGGVESWSPDGGYVAVGDRSTPSQRMRLIDPITRRSISIDTGADFLELLAWVVA
jgi:dipeptidyl aminopeptidase/acylaminoacyl peptidase